MKSVVRKQNLKTQQSSEDADLSGNFAIFLLGSLVVWILNFEMFSIVSVLQAQNQFSNLNVLSKIRYLL